MEGYNSTNSDHANAELQFEISKQHTHAPEHRMGRQFMQMRFSKGES